MTALWIHEIVEQFWRDATGAPPGFPRDLREAVGWALPVTPVELPDLSIARINGWLAERNFQLHLTIPNRALRAGIIVYEANGVLFIDQRDADDEQRFSLAHEIAHYLIEYAVPRQRARSRLGDRIVPVLDGRRVASLDERIGALLGGVTLGPSLHLMERTPDGHTAGAVVSAAERHADTLAFELLAPLAAVRAAVSDGAWGPEIEAALRATFGLPASAAGEYARVLAPEPPVGSLFRQLFTTA